MDWLVIGLSAALGFVTLFAAVYTQNWIMGLLVLGVGTFLLFGTTAMSAGPAPAIDNFVEAVGAAGVLAALVGGAAGAYAGNHYRQAA